MPTTEQTALRIGELARIVGVSPDTLRHYERIGVIAKAQRLGSGYRVFPPEAVQQVRLARRALAMGFSLVEIANIRRLRESGNPPCRQVRALAEEKLAALDRKLDELTRHRNQIREVLRVWDIELARTPAGQPAGLLQMIPESFRLTLEPVRRSKLGT
jgi:DNA-binding transcriptional MerR regulator